MPRKGASGAASIIAAIGASGSGKSLWIKQQLKRGNPRRLLVWDPQGEYSTFGAVHRDRLSLVTAVMDAERGAGQFVYQPGNNLSEYPVAFDWCCRLAYAWQQCTVVADELGDVTKAGWAPDGWSLCIRKGRHAGLRILGAAQRPAIIDKTFFALATMIHCGRLNYAADVKTMADVLGVPGADLVALKPLDWIERDMQTGATRRGKIAV